MREILFQGGHQLWHAVEDAPPQPLLSVVAEEALHHIEPGCACRGEVQMKAQVPGQPSLHLGVLVRGVVVQNQMDLAVRRRLLVNEL